MTLKESIIAKLELSNAIEEWWNKSEVANRPMIGEDVIELMAIAALQVLIAIDNTQKYLQQEDMLKDE